MRNIDQRPRIGKRATTGLLAVAVAVAALVASMAVGASAPNPNQNQTDATFTKDSSCIVGTHPLFPAFDPVHHYVYVPNSGSHSVSVLSGTCTLHATITLPSSSEPWAAAFDPQDNELYVTNASVPGSVFVISGTKLVATLTVPQFDSPRGIVYDPAEDLGGVMVVTNFDGNSLSAIRGGSVLDEPAIPVGTGPNLLAYDPLFDRILVTNYGSKNVTSIPADNLLSPTHTNIPVGTTPTGIVYDFANGLDYVDDQGTNNVTVIDALGIHFGSIGVGGAPTGIAWSQATLRVYVTNANTHNVSVISGMSVVNTLTISATTAAPWGAAYDEVNDKVYVAASASNVVYVFS